MVVHLIEILEGSDPSKYYDAVGRFVSMFSTVEEYMQRALWRCSGIAAPIAPAIFSGTRVDAASGYIKRIAEAQNWPKEEREELDEIVSQLSEITRLRNDILHYGANWSSPTELTVSNELLAHTPAKIRTTKVSTKILNDLSHDLHKIIFHLLVLADRGTDQVPDRAYDILRRAWRYKPERQQGQAGKRPQQRPR